MIERGVEIGPGSIRVGRFIGRLGVVPMPAVGHGLGLVDRVVRRHVAKLEKVGWCERTPALRGEGMLVWMTPTGLDGVGLGELPAPRAPNPFSPRILRSTRVAWAAADIERAGYQWIASRELALAPGGWGAEIANERGGYSRRLPDLVFWSARDRRRQAAWWSSRGYPIRGANEQLFEGWQPPSWPVDMHRSSTWPLPPPPATCDIWPRTSADRPAVHCRGTRHSRRASVLASIIENVDEARWLGETAPVAAPDPLRPSPEQVVRQRRQ